ncbi:hypothetical protein LS74_008765 [Helicobacter magdeburgensis]|uniref:Thioredoxin-like fold domain-containing protein n=1 Tax=Helicobacter magdeburgensis TaxID=471858 RepID=A0A4U8SWX3_9HELI|nr:MULTISPECIES: thioredoxin fold domain-containing protein [Helicobacter]TLD91423.1 hypothetical protein LS74_008765 [Helicobacter magdeburgensis]BDB64402.1 hypothetical protein T36_0854 [Helicobacter cinaedi]
MKTKFALSVLCALSVAYGAADKAELQKTLQANSVQGNIISSSDLGSGLSMVVIDVNNQQVPFLATNDGKFIFQPDVLLIQDKAVQTKIKGFYKDVYEKEKAKINIKLQEVFKKQSANVFHFKSQKNGAKTIYIVSDANCPYCQKEFANLNKRLEDANVELLVVGFLGEDSMLKAANALKNKSGNQAKDIAMLAKLYEPKSKATSMDTKLAQELTQAVADTGVRSVPYIIED